MSEAARKLRANRKIEGKPCGHCGTQLALGDEAAVCGTCEFEHHARCWDDQGGCARKGCVNAPLQRLDTPAPEQPAAGAASAYGWGQTARAAQPLRPGMKHCISCQNQIPAHAEICDYCNAIVTPDGVYHGPTVTAPGATAALVCGILGLVLFWLFFGITGFVLGGIAITKSREARSAINFNPRYGGEGLAIAGLVLGIIALVLSAGGLLLTCAVRSTFDGGF